MRAILAPLLAVSTIAAADTPNDQSTGSSADAALPAASAPPPSGGMVVLGHPSKDGELEKECRDRITQARKEAGKPPLLDREPASPDQPYHIYAVDRRQDGCSVMVIAGDPADIRPLPAMPDGLPLVMPLGAGK